MEVADVAIEVVHLLEGGGVFWSGRQRHVIGMCLCRCSLSEETAD